LRSNEFSVFELPVCSVRERSQQKMIQGQWRQLIQSKDSMQQDSNQRNKKENTLKIPTTKLATIKFCGREAVRSNA
jgi:hypothetical protein